jgi:hypothetical protein
MGKAKVQTVPFLVFVEKEIEPSMACMRLLEIERPRPNPLSANSPFVVKKGSNIFDRILFGIPEPLSSTEITKSSFLTRALTVTRSPEGDASIPFFMTFNSTRRSGL